MQQNALLQIYLFDLNSNAAFKLNKLNELHCTLVKKCLARARGGKYPSSNKEGNLSTFLIIIGLQ